MISPRCALLAVLLITWVWTVGCAARSQSVSADVSQPAASACRDASYRGQFEPGDGSKPTRFRMRARACQPARILIEVRGPVGGAQLVTAIDDERVLLLLPGERRAAEGSIDSEQLWREETGLPFSARVLSQLARADAEATVELSGWSVRRIDDSSGELPRLLEATNAAGAHLTVRKESEKPARRGFEWPQVPAGFERTSYDL